MLTIERVGDYNGHGYPVEASCNAQEATVSGVSKIPEIILRRASDKPMNSAGTLPGLRKSRP
jgi:hypothetical protein